MPYSPVPSKAEGDTGYTAAQINQWIRDNEQAGIPDLMTTKGDLVAATAADAAARVAAGANDAFLWADSSKSTGMVSGKLARVSAGEATYQIVSSVGTQPQINKVSLYDTEDIDNSGSFASNTFTAPHPGYYLISVFCADQKPSAGTSQANASAGEHLYYKLYKNGALETIVGGDILQVALGNLDVMGFSAGGTDIIFLSEGDTVEVYIDTDIGLAVYLYINYPGQATTSAHLFIAPLV